MRTPALLLLTFLGTAVLASSPSSVETQRRSLEQAEVRLENLRQSSNLSGEDTKALEDLELLLKEVRGEIEEGPIRSTRRDSVQVRLRLSVVEREIEALEQGNEDPYSAVP